MSSERWDDVFAIFDAALTRSGAERDALLERACGDNARLRDEVESLLAANRDAQGFLSGGPVRATSAPGAPSSADPGILIPGTRIGVFEIESFAGAGGMGEVYRARDTRLERHVALKVLWPDTTGDMRGRARLAYEARAIARLSHPHICALHDIGHQDGVDFLVMEYLHGETLASRLRRGPLPVAEAVRIAIQIAEALDAAHAEGIVHSDLKPANIMLVDGGSAREGALQSKLLDFGLARFLLTPAIAHAGMAAASDHSGSIRRGAIAGTPQYTGPRTSARRKCRSPERHLLVWQRALRNGLGTRGVRRCHHGGGDVRRPSREPVEPADRAGPCGQGFRDRVTPARQGDRALPGKGPRAAVQSHTRRGRRTSTVYASRGGRRGRGA